MIANDEHCPLILHHADLQHALFLLTTHGKLFLAPLGNEVHQVLDIATVCLAFVTCTVPSAD